MTKAKKRSIDSSTEDRIKAAAKKLFTRKGFAATRTRDIAEEAGINLALLNYYFRSKQKLYEIIMRENVVLFIGGMIENISRPEKLTLEQKLEIIVDKYIDMLLENPDLPFFILSISRSGQVDLQNDNEPIIKGMKLLRESLFADIEENIRQDKLMKLHPVHFIANLMGLIVFPFMASNIIRARAGNISKTEYEQLMLERKKLIPVWVRSMFENHPSPKTSRK